MKGHQCSDCAASTSTLRVIEVNAQTDPRWEALVQVLPHSLIYHHPAWLQVLEEAYGYKPVNLACEDATGELRGILPLFYSRGLLSGSRFSSLPRTPVAGPLAYNKQAMAVLVHAAIERARDKSGSHLQIKMLSNDLDGLVDGVVGTPWRETYLLELPEHPDLLHFNSRIKWAVNKATKIGVHVRPAETECDLRAWYDLYLDTMRSVTMLPRPYHFFEIAWQRLQPHGLLRLLLAEYSQAGRTRLLAGSLFLMFGQTIFYAFNGWRRQDRSLRPNDLLQWQAIQDACASGFCHYDFGEVDENNASLAQFKSKWGTEQKLLYRYYYPTPRQVEISILELARRKAFVNTAWQRLPIKATALLSGLAHRYF